MKLIITTITLLVFSLPLVAASHFQLLSPAFKDNQPIPEQYSKNGLDVSPPFSLVNIPKGTQSLALVCEDPDAPGGTWIHWVLYNIPPSLTHISEGGSNLSKKVTVGKNSWGNLSYNGPQPPIGTHHYEFKLYALDAPLNLAPGLESEELKKAIQGHILGETKLIGLYTH
ncbi:MAG: hypothetical protein ACD_16C00211G0003 [uncultured bacterium]|nr:MAG: hypothetical protein ACD_16C00211G0003 [uncultured bacterium]HBG35174.1 YbhB/YbcL family Raf kinase inhibitor-like protein [Holosporales bacterium]HBW24281.1 YbhB/YbcL family Raf kinase inhibitor-like protein [Holosporales bacterium]HCC25037.1 YbhB/YbcL family Raf kinase inhibitor-like protein [Holosporales bacterium]HCE96631.1 YbhB/YbcL family Raf kinase inhibitor-like protein [Holosporales bacterium]